jgi:hypothetical protein
VNPQTRRPPFFPSKPEKREPGRHAGDAFSAFLFGFVGVQTKPKTQRKNQNQNLLLTFRGDGYG